MHDKFKSGGVADCIAKQGNAENVPRSGPDNPGCHAAVDQFVNSFGSMQLLAVLFLFLPLVVGLFFGAPLIARELEHGTHRLVWTQGVSRGRWAAAKIGFVGGGVLVLAAGYAALLSWWIEPLSRAEGNRFSELLFDMQGVVPLAYTLFAVALGIFAGTIGRKVLPAMAITLGGFIVVRLLVTGLARERYMATVERQLSVVSEVEPNPFRGDWIVDAATYDASGNVVRSGGMMLCRPPSESGGGSQPAECAATNYNLMHIHPAERFWQFQWIETGLYAALAAVLLFFAVRRIRRIA